MTLAGILTSVSFVAAKACIPIFCRLLGRPIFVSAVPEKAPSPIWISVDGSLTDSRFLQLLKAKLSISSTPSGISTLVSMGQSENDEMPIATSEVGSSISLISGLQVNATLPIIFTPSGTVTFLGSVPSG